MAKKQKRRSISLHPHIYAALQERCKAMSVSMSGQVEKLIKADFALAGIQLEIPMAPTRPAVTFSEPTKACWWCRKPYMPNEVPTLARGHGVHQRCAQAMSGE